MMMCILKLKNILSVVVYLLVLFAIVPFMILSEVNYSSSKQDCRGSLFVLCDSTPTISPPPTELHTNFLEKHSCENCTTTVDNNNTNKIINAHGYNNTTYPDTSVEFDSLLTRVIDIMVPTVIKDATKLIVGSTGQAQCVNGDSATCVSTAFDPTNEIDDINNDKQKDDSQDDTDTTAEVRSGETDVTEVEVGGLSPFPLEDYVKYFQAGDIAEKFRDLGNKSLDAFIGKWQIIPKRSEPVDGIMKALGFGMIKIKVMANYISVADLEIKTPGASPSVLMKTHLPLSQIKEGVVHFDGNWHKMSDKDTGEMDTLSIYREGRLLQHRKGTFGVMHDSRIIIDKDPEGIESGPLQLFTWVVTTPKGEVFRSDRWMKKVLD